MLDRSQKPIYCLMNCYNCFNIAGHATELRSFEAHQCLFVALLLKYMSPEIMIIINTRTLIHKRTTGNIYVGFP